MSKRIPDMAAASRRPVVPDMAPERGPAHTVKQSRFPHAPQLPTLLVVQGPSMSGKSSALQRLFTEVWVGSNRKSVFDRILSLIHI